MRSPLSYFSPQVDGDRVVDSVRVSTEQPTSTDTLDVSTIGGTAQVTAVRATTSRPCLLRFLESEEADMVHRPRSVIGYLFSFLLVLGVGYVVISGRNTMFVARRGSEETLRRAESTG